MGVGWRFDSAGVDEVIARTDADARSLSSELGTVAATLEQVIGQLDDVVGAALRRFEERWLESAEAVDRRTVAVVETARAVVRDHLSTDEEMAGSFGPGLWGAEVAGRPFAPRITQRPGPLSWD